MAVNEEPDSARSWAIATAGFVINLLLSGISRSTALFYVALIESYGTSRMEANMPFTLRSIVRNISGPLVGIIGQHCGTREVTIAGGLFAFVGVASCCFVSDITWISVLWGGIHGIGVALGNTLYQITVNQYFERHRATASGLSLSGSCAGSFVFPVIFEYLLTNIGLPGTFLLTGGLMLHVIPAGMLMIEPSWIKNESKVTLGKDRDYSAEGNIKTFSGKPVVMEDFSEKDGEIFAIAYKRIPSTHDIFSKRESEVMKNEDKNGNHNFQDVQYTKSPIEKLESDDKVTSSPEKNFSIFQDIIRMICDPMFHVISLSLAAIILSFDICLTIIVDYLQDKGISASDGKYFITMAAVGDFIGRMGFGWVTDRKYMSLSKYMILVQVIQGGFGMMPFLGSFNALMILVVVCCMASGASIVVFPVLVVKYLHSVQSLAIGSTTFVGGLIAFVVPPMIGYFRDSVGSYDNLYLVISAFTIMTGFLWGLEPLIMKWKVSTGDSSVEINVTTNSENTYL